MRCLALLSLLNLAQTGTDVFAVQSNLGHKLTFRIPGCSFETDGFIKELICKRMFGLFVIGLPLFWCFYFCQLDYTLLVVCVEDRKCIAAANRHHLACYRSPYRIAGQCSAGNKYCQAREYFKNGQGFHIAIVALPIIAVAEPVSSRICQYVIPHTDCG